MKQKGLGIKELATPLFSAFSKSVIQHFACSSQIAADSRTRDRSLVDSSNLHDHACARMWAHEKTMKSNDFMYFMYIRMESNENEMK